MKNKILFIISVILFSLLCIFIINLSRTPKYSEPQIIVSTSNKKITAHTGSFCDNTKCVDKLSIFETDYDDYLSVIPGDKIYIEDLDENISTVKFYEDSNSIELVEEEIIINHDEKYIIVPNYIGTYIVLIATKYENRNISYSFKVEIKSNDNVT